MLTPLAQHLLLTGLLPASLLERAHQRQNLEGGSLDTALLEQGSVSEGSLLQVLSDVSSIRSVNLADFVPNPALASLIPAKVAERLCVVPLSVDGPMLHVACSYPPPGRELEEVAFLLGKQLERWVALECRVRRNGMQKTRAVARG